VGLRPSFFHLVFRVWTADIVLGTAEHNIMFCQVLPDRFGFNPNACFFSHVIG
jgi:hypothetical protein